MFITPPPGNNLYSVSLTHAKSQGTFPNPRFAQTARPNTGRGTMRTTAHTLYTQPTYRTSEFSHDLHEMLSRAKKQKSLDNYSVHQFEELLGLLHQERKKLATDHRFSEGDTINRIIDHVNKYYVKAKTKENQQIERIQFEKKNSEFENQFKLFDDETKTLEEELLQNQANRTQEMIERHQNEFDRFEERWTSDQKQRIYNKGTNHLLSLHNSLKQLLVQSRFQEAQAVQQQIDERSQLEEADHFDLIQHDYNESLRNLQDRQQLEMESFQEKLNIELNTFRQQRKRLRQAYVNRQIVMKTHEDLINDPEKLWKRTEKKRIRKSLTLLSRDTQYMPPTRMKVSELRNDKSVPILKLPKLDTKRTTEKKTKELP